MKCPVCKKDWPKIGLKNHIVKQARNELWQREFGKIKKTPHLDFVKKHLDNKKVFFRFNF